MAKHVAIYVRVSSRQQDTASQRPDLERYAAAQELPAVWYSDKFTGRTMQRPGWSKLVAAMQRGEIASVVVWRLDRLGRTARGLTELFETLQERRVNLVSIRDGIDLGTSAGRLMANVLASISQFETEVRAERVLAGQAAAKARGRRWGGSRPGWHYKATPEKIVAIREMHAAKKPKTVIAATVGLSRQTVYDILRSKSA